ncbi:ABC transporter ATP-binding protein [Virgibacillus xinjiangensis]|uniref:ABC transporter ATP-binding protein n=1 Tax=Virgibacillus xinjiangensis TaxID=393090 RepID=A0ABV7CSM3_9BACI
MKHWVEIFADGWIPFMAGNDREGFESMEAAVMNRLKETPLLEVRGFGLSFLQYSRGWKEKNVQVISELDLSIHKGEIVAVIGASGSGKSLLADAILGILPANAQPQGELLYHGEKLTQAKQRLFRGDKIALIPQSVQSLNPLIKAGKQVGKSGGNVSVQPWERVGMTANLARKYPFELSGGMARRVLTATALQSDPELVIADEPTPGLDSAVLEETMEHIRQIAENGAGVMFITHDISTALKISDRLVIMNEGRTVETALASDFAGKGERLKEAYTRKLWRALPQNDFAPVPRRDDSMPKKDNTLEAVGVTYRYDRAHNLFRKLNFTIGSGEVVGLYGPSGSGKTTLAQLLAGYRKPLEGKVMVDGRSVPERGGHPVQLIWQHPERAVNPRWKLKKVWKEAGIIEPEVMKQLGIRAEWLDRYPSELSGGELQRICVARAFHPSVRYIIADEMTTMLDAWTQSLLWEAVLHHAYQRNIGILAISHDASLLERISTRVIDYESILTV